MNRPIFTGLVLSAIALMGLAAIFIFMQKVQSPTTDNNITEVVTTDNVTLASEEYLYTCEPTNIYIDYYTDPGKQLESCFIEYPGEVTRESTDYYIVEDICGQFTQLFMENMLAKEIKDIKAAETTGVYSCSYYLQTVSEGKEKYITLNLEYLPLVDQKIAHESMGRIVEMNNEIPMQNYVVMQEDGVTNSIYLGLSENKFISIRPNTINVLSNDEYLDLAINIAKEIRLHK